MSTVGAISGSLAAHLVEVRREEVDHPRRRERDLPDRLGRSDGQRSEEVLGAAHARDARSQAGGSTNGPYVSGRRVVRNGNSASQSRRWSRSRSATSTAGSSRGACTSTRPYGSLTNDEP